MQLAAAARAIGIERVEELHRRGDDHRHIPILGRETQPAWPDRFIRLSRASRDLDRRMMLQHDVGTSGA
jgi:hypothetical protein